MNAIPTVPQPCRVKVCGIRDPAEARSLDALGVDWIGFNFHPGSSRHIPAEAAAPIIGSLRSAVPVGVFVDAPVEEVLRIIAVTGIRAVQLHGSEDGDYVRRMPIPVIKAIPHDRLADAGGMREAAAGRTPGTELSKGPASPLAFFLVDTQAGAGGFGGSGKTFDWSLLARHPLPLPYFLAGGLGPDNLATALRACSPFAVDLNSKVETAPGRKDLDKVKACLEIVRGG